MIHLFGIVLAIALLAFVLWLLSGTSASGKGAAKADQVIDANDDRSVGLFIGLTGGTITDAATARFVLRRFEAEQGRKPITRDVATLVAMMNAMKG